MTNITELAQRIKAAAEKATPGEWWADEVKNEGCYGSGDDCVEGFTSYAIYGSDGQTLFDSLNSDAACISEEYDGEGHVAWDETAQRNAEFIALANPANILALVEALEKVQAAERRWHRVASRIHEQACESDVKIDELEAIRAAAEKLVRCKGRYHSEQNYRALAALFGVTTPDLPPLEHENVHYADAAEMEIAALRQRIAELESRTVKLPQRHITQFRKGFNGYHNEMAYKADEVQASLAAAGIKVEAEMKIRIVLQELKEDGVLTTYSNGHVEMLPYRIDENGEEYVEMLPNDIEQH
ncbi:ead/Ea22-like family protein [Klebsiella pneumoniae]|nr:ead/Ea22-like family protein [Klebsiella pneumoniae]MCW9159965.1 ead/Ea22-like family protein [Klebsiella pneumoniae]